MRYTPAILTVGIFLAAVSAFPSSAGDAPYDVVIRNGKVVDGTGNPWRYADVAVKEDKIVQAGPSQLQDIDHYLFDPSGDHGRHRPRLTSTQPRTRFQPSLYRRSASPR